MIKPSMEEARGYCGDYQSIPISLELFSDIKTPIEVLKVLKATGKKCYLLESVEGGTAVETADGLYLLKAESSELVLKLTEQTGGD